MSAIDKFKELFDKLTTQRGDQWLEKIPAWLGDHTGQVATGTPGLIFVRTAEGQVLTVFNNIAPAEYNILVKIGRSKDQPHLWQVIERREVWSVPASSSVVHHHWQHMFEAPDEVPIDRRQILQLSVRVYDPAGFIVRVGGSIVLTGAGIREISTQFVDLSSYVVTAGAKFVSIESDDEGVLSVNEGAVFASPEIGTFADIPSPDPGKHHVASVLLFEGQSQLLNSHIRVPFPLAVIAKSSGLQIDEAAADTPLDADEFGFWDVVDSLLKKITWSNIKAILKTYFDTVYSALGHTHSGTDADYTDISANDTATDVTGAELEELTNGSTTTLHAHSGGGGLPNPFALTADITPTALSADVNDYNPTGLATADVLRLEASGDHRQITGLAGGADGRIITIHNIGSTYRIFLADDSSSSSAANRFLGAGIFINPNKSVTLQYDATVSRWRFTNFFTGIGFDNTEGDPSSVAGTASDGTSAFAARRDHIHDGSWVLIEDKLLGADTPSFDFQSIPAIYKALKIVVVARSDRAASASDGALLKINNDTGNNYLGVIQWGGPSPGWVQQGTAGAPTLCVYVTAASSPASWFGHTEIIIPNYANTSIYKPWQARGTQPTTSGGTVWVYDAAGEWLSTSAISRVTIYPQTGSNFKQYSRAALYGMK